MTYQLLKAVHMVSVMTFIGGLLLLAVLANARNLPVLRTAHRWDRHVTLPALALVWITGFAIAMQGHWLGDAWLMIKLVAVAGLSGLHAALAGTLRRIELDVAATAPRFFGQAGIAVIAGVTVVVFLVILKPA